MNDKNHMKRTRLRRKAELEYARTYNELDNSEYEYQYKDLYQNLYNDDGPVMKDVRTTFFNHRLYGEPNTFAGYANQNVDNEVYQALVNDKPRQEVHNIYDYQKKYFLEDGITFK